jgi:hypothetical protein
MKAAAARSKILSTGARTSTHAPSLLSRLRDRIRSYTRVLIAELLCATSCEVA